MPENPALGDTLQDTEAHDARPIDSTPLRTLAFSERYTATMPIGAGGMGVVHAVRDEQIGREIAIKRLLSSQRNNAGIRARFEREARVQAQLEHPSIVPVYDLGIDAAGDAWFTMKKIRGVTLAQVIEKLRAGDAETAAKFTRRRLLTAFTNVCLAVDFAHQRGIVHRDLKPANVMLGDFGEVYVLDWGIAHIAGVSDADLSRAALTTPGAGPNTEAGEILGTVGYMPPEQLTGASTIGPHSDVWALGAMLFELLALEPLMPRTSLAEALAALADPDIERRPSMRAIGRVVPPELDAICRRATARAIEDRHASARQLQEDVASFLDADIDSQRRHDQAAAHVARARDAEQRAATQRDDGAAQRTVAMQEINKALAIDPTNEDARSAMVRMMMEPAPSLPDAARAELEDVRLRETRIAFRIGAGGFLSMFLFLPFYLWMGIRDWPLTSAVMALIVTSAGLLWWGSSSTRRAPRALQLTVVSAGILIALLTRVVGPFASAPMLAFLMAVGLVFNRTALGVRSLLSLVVIAVGIPIALEATGVIEPSYAFEAGRIIVRPHMTSLPPIATMVTLTLTCVSTIAFAALFLMRVHAALRATQERLWGFSWNLRQFLPTLPPS